MFTICGHAAYAHDVDGYNKSELKLTFSSGPRGSRVHLSNLCLPDLFIFEGHKSLSKLIQDTMLNKL